MPHPALKPRQAPTQCPVMVLSFSHGLPLLLLRAVVVCFVALTTASLLTGCVVAHVWRLSHGPREAKFDDVRRISGAWTDGSLLVVQLEGALELPPRHAGRPGSNPPLEPFHLSIPLEALTLEATNALPREALARGPAPPELTARMAPVPAIDLTGRHASVRERAMLEAASTAPLSALLYAAPAEMRPGMRAFVLIGQRDGTRVDIYRVELDPYITPPNKAYLPLLPLAAVVDVGIILPARIAIYVFSVFSGSIILVA